MGVLVLNCQDLTVDAHATCMQHGWTRTPHTCTVGLPPYPAGNLLLAGLVIPAWRLHTEPALRTEQSRAVFIGRPDKQSLTDPYVGLFPGPPCLYQLRYQPPVSFFPHP